jgi:hypothetical protein
MAKLLPTKLLEEAVRVTEEQRAMLADAATRELSSEDVLMLMAELGRRQAEVRELLGKVAGRLGLPSGAKPRLLSYLLATRGKVVGKDELSGISGIHEWARRIRELRVEDGWRISSNDERADLRPGQYVLEDDHPNLEAVRQWQTANRIRRSGGPASQRILEFLLQNIGKPVSQDELAYVSRIHAFPRRIRELAEDGWPIESSLDRSDLKPGEYVLVAAEKRTNLSQPAVQSSADDH